MRKLVSVAVSLMSLAGAAYAENPNTGKGISAAISAGVINPDDARPLDSGVFYDFSLGYRFGPAVELALSYLEADFEADSNIQGASIEPGYELDLRYHFSNGETQPYAALGFSNYGYSFVDPTVPEQNHDFLPSAALGVKIFTTSSIFAVGEVKHILDNEQGDTLVSFGLGATFGEAAGKSYKPAAKPAPAPAAKKQPAPSPAPTPVVFLDADKDGIEDGKDRCPVTPVGVSVDSVGCAVDSDKDGIANYKDECPNTVAGARVDDAGCEIKFVNQKESLAIRVNFATNSANLRPGSDAEIKKAADFLASYDDAKLVVEGHTDNTGSAAYNKSLSQKRADAVRQVLIDTFNVDPARVSAIGYGEERPIADNNTATGRQTNRRVVGVVEGQKSVRVKQAN